MKKLLVVLMALALVAGLSSISYAAIGGSAHDFSGAGWNSSGEICNVCHTPHNPDNPADGPLWDHASTTFSTYTLYSNAAGTLQSSPGQPTGLSKVCLSCHDGTVALDAFGGVGGSTQMASTAAGYIGTDLSDDHPISIDYNTTLANADGELVDPSGDGDTDANTVGAATPYLPLYSGSLECQSCHDVHDNDNAPFLRMSNSSSLLCLKCHTK